MATSLVERLARIARTVYFAVELFGTAFTCNAVQILSVLLIPFSSRAVLVLNQYIAYFVWRRMQQIFEVNSGGRVTFSGDPIPKNESAIIMSNHKSFSDFYLLHALALRKNMLMSCKYFAKDSLKYIPGWGMYFTGMVLIKRNWTEDKERINNTFELIRTSELPVWVVSFAEGSRSTPDKIKESQEFCEKNGFAQLKHVLHPRTKGMVCTIQGLRNTHVKAIYDVTIAYRHVSKSTSNGSQQIFFNSPPSILRVHTHPLSNEYQFHVHTRRFLLSELPTGDSELSEWIRDRYVEKDRLLSTWETSWVDKELIQEEPSPWI